MEHNNKQTENNKDSTVKGKKRVRKNTVTKSPKKNKPSPVIKVDEETITTGTICDNAINSPEIFSNDIENGIYTSNSSSEDDNSLIDIVFTKILNKKKMELMESEEIKERLRPRKKI